MSGPRKTFIHPGRFELMRERFQLDWIRPAAPDRMCKMGELMDGVLRGMGVEETDPLTRLRRAWPELAGPAAARRVRPAALQRGVLILHVDHAMDLMEWRPRLPELVAKARRVLSEQEVRQARLAIGP